MKWYCIAIIGKDYFSVPKILDKLTDNGVKPEFIKINDKAIYYFNNEKVTIF